MQAEVKTPAPSEILKYWNTFEFFNFYDLDDGLKNCKPEDCIEINQHTSSFPWQDADLLGKSKFIIYFGLTTADELIEFLQLEEEDKFQLQKSGQKTCIGKIELSDEHGFAKLDGLSVSSLHWAVTRFARNEVPLSESFLRYRQSLLDIFNNTMIPHVRTRRTQEVNWFLLNRIFSRFLMENPKSPDREARDIWCPHAESPTFIVTKASKSRPSYVIHKLQKEFSDPGKKVDFTKFEKSISELLASMIADDDHESQLKALATDMSTLTDSQVSEKKLESIVGEAFKVEEIAILNSFFLIDLERAINSALQGGISPTLNDYLKQMKQYRNLFASCEKRSIFEAVSPKKMPLGRWPSSPRFAMSLMQQFAINRITNHPEETVFSVNGPPGTGKTTLLKDVIADVMVKRARVLASLNKPSEGFDSTLEMSCRGYKFSPLCRKLTGFEMVIASGNNGAVENISKELPLVANIAKDYCSEASFLSRISRLWQVHEDKKFDPNQTEDKYWGPFSVALGRRKNIKTFTDQTIYEPKQAEKNPAIKRFVDASCATLAQWIKAPYDGPKFDQAKREFLAALQAVEQHQNDLEQEYQRCLQWLEAKETRQTLQAEKAKLEGVVHGLARQIKFEKQKLDDIRHVQNSLKEPGFWDWIFHRSFYVKQNKYKAELSDAILSCKRSIGKLWNQYAEAQSEYDDIQDQLNRLIKHGDLPDHLQQIVRLMDGDIDSKDLQMITPLQDEKANDLRAKLFLKAMTLHESWLNAVKSSHLRTLVYNLDRLLTHKPSRSSDAGFALFQQFFMLVPVVSATFASIQSFLHGIPDAAFGWLFVDEAGQATPQAAAGGMMRFRKAVVVGDPLQLEPIVSMPPRIAEGIRGHFEMHFGDLAEYNPAVRSVQTVADTSHQWGGTIGETRVGCPLRVHRRCLNPMFRLANMIAYDGKMIMGRGEKIPVVENFGASSWLHVTGEAVGQRRHWVKEQGEVAFRLMQAVALDPALASADAAAKNVYVISPFREVVREFSKFILSQDPLPGHLTINSRWCRENVGTIHTFQGKEADVVIMILGLDEVKRYAAQTMVDYKPNLLNVAATRAKKHFFIIGDRHLWEPVYSFDSAAKILPVIEINDHPLLADKWPVSPAREIHHVPQSVHEHETATIRS